MEKYNHVLPIEPIHPYVLTGPPKLMCYGNYENPNYGVHTMAQTFHDKGNDHFWTVYYSYDTPIALVFSRMYSAEYPIVAMTDTSFGEANTTTTRRHMSMLMYKLRHLAGGRSSWETVRVFPEDVFEKIVLHNVFNPNHLLS